MLSDQAINAICNIVLAVAAIITLVFTVKANRETARSNAEAAKNNKDITDLNFRQTITAAQQHLAKELLATNPDENAIHMARQNILNAYETVCYLRRNEIESEDFWTLYGNDILSIIHDKNLSKLIPLSGEAYKYIREAGEKLENSKT